MFYCEITAPPELFKELSTVLQCCIYYRHIYLFKAQVRPTDVRAVHVFIYALVFDFWAQILYKLVYICPFMLG